MKKYVLLLVISLSFSMLTTAQTRNVLRAPKSKRYTNPILTPNPQYVLLLKIEGIDGESNEKNHKKWVELESYYFDNNVKMGKSREKVMELVIHKFPDASSIDIALNASTGRHIPKIELEVLQTINGKLEPVFKYELENVVFDLYSIEASSSKDSLMEIIKLNAPNVEMTYYKYDTSGNFINKSDRLLRAR